MLAHTLRRSAGVIYSMEQSLFQQDTDRGNNSIVKALIMVDSKYVQYPPVFFPNLDHKAASKMFLNPALTKVIF